MLHLMLFAFVIGFVSGSNNETDCVPMYGKCTSNDVCCSKLCIINVVKLDYVCVPDPALDRAVDDTLDTLGELVLHKKKKDS